MAVKKEKTKNNKKAHIDVTAHTYIKATFNNTIISITNQKGDVIAISSSGKMKFKGKKKNTPYAAQTVAKDVSQEASNLGVKQTKVYVKGPGPGREAAIRAIENSGIKILTLEDRTAIPHNGCRPPKVRRN